MKLTKAEIRLRNLMIVYVVMFLAGGLEFYLIPDRLLSDIYWFGSNLGFDTVAPSQERFWNFLAVSLMVTITVCSLIAAVNIRKNRLFVSPVIFSKLASSLSAIYAFWQAPKQGFAYLVIFITDFPLFVLAVIFYTLVDIEKKFSKTPTTNEPVAAPPAAIPPPEQGS